MIESVRLRCIDRSPTAIANLDIRRDFGANAAPFGALQSASCFLFAMAQIPAGFFADRIRPCILIRASLAFWSIAVAAGSFALTCSQLLIARAMLA